MQDFFSLPTRKIYVFSEMYFSQKKYVKLKRFPFKDKSSQNFFRSLVKLKCIVFKFPVYKILKLANDIIFIIREYTERLWCFEVSNYFAIGENLRKQALSKNFNAAHSRKTKSISRLMKS